MDPFALGIAGSTQPEVFRKSVDAMVRMLQTDAQRFWQEALHRDGPIDIWVIAGERFLFNGNHRFHAAIQAGVEIPDDSIRIADMSGTNIPTFLIKDLTWIDSTK